MIEFYERKLNIEINKVIQSPVEDICLVTYGINYDLVEVCGFKPKILSEKVVNNEPKLTEWLDEQIQK